VLIKSPKAKESGSPEESEEVRSKTILSYSCNQQLEAGNFFSQPATQSSQLF
jgi:uncharacterized protein YgiM (DUF1202 family)